MRSDELSKYEKNLSELEYLKLSYKSIYDMAK